MSRSSQSHFIYGAPTLCPVSPRMALVEVGVPVGGDTMDARFYTVLAIQTTPATVYRNSKVPKKGQPFPELPRFAEHAPCVEAGWAYERSDSILEFVLATKDTRGVALASEVTGECLDHSTWRVVPAPWSEDEDKTRLVNVVNELQTLLQKQIEEEKAREANAWNPEPATHEQRAAMRAKVEELRARKQQGGEAE